MFKDYDVAKLACAVCGIYDEEAEEHIEDDAVDDVLLETYGIEFDHFSNLINALLPMTPVAISPLTKTHFHVFMRNGVAIVKTEAAQQEN